MLGAERLDPAPQDILADVQVATGLHDRDPAPLDQPDRPQLERPAEQPPSYPNPSISWNTLNTVSTEPAAAHTNG